ncbi:MAG TPA: thioredoxin fold domain-containing protein [Halalkalibaculum sp.]|nr:thioredoxin fold domain-containing protein [Halalkalibaculum sp.]
MKPRYLLYLLPLIALAAFSAYEGQKPEEITWYSMQEAQELAVENDKKVLVYAEAVWCTYCKKMENEVFPRQEVIDSLARYYYPVRVDIESDKKLVFNEETLTGSQFARKYRVQGTPTFFFIDKNGQILGAQPGFIPHDVFTNLLAFVGSDAHERVSFDEYTGENKN